MNVLTGDWQTVSEPASDDRKAKMDAFLGILKKRAPMPEQMPAAAVLEQLHSAGVSVWLDGANLRAKGALTNETRDLIRQHKALLIEHLTMPAPEVHTTWDHASCAALIDGTRRELAQILALCDGSRKKEAAFDAAFNCMAMALEWMADVINKREVKRLTEHTDYLAWLCKEVRGWADGTIPMPPKELYV